MLDIFGEMQHEHWHKELQVFDEMQHFKTRTTAKFLPVCNLETVPCTLYAIAYENIPK